MVWMCPWQSITGTLGESDVAAARWQEQADMFVEGQPGPAPAPRDPGSCHALLPPGPWDVPSMLQRRRLTRLPCAVLSCVR